MPDISSVYNSTYANKFNFQVDDAEKSVANKKESEAQSLSSLTSDMLIDYQKNNAKVQNKDLLLTPPADAGNLSLAAVKAEILQILDKHNSGVDIDTSNAIIASLASLAGAQMSKSITTGTSDNSSKSAIQNVTSRSASGKAAHSHKTVNGATDISASTSAVKSSYVNIMGDFNVVDALVEILSLLNKQEGLSNQQAAMMSQIQMDSSVAAGDKGIAAAQEQMTGSIAAGVMSLSMQTGATASTIKSLNTESKSITKNLSKSNDIELAVNKNQSEIHASAQSLAQEGHHTSREVDATLSRDHHEDMHRSTNHRHEHKKVENNTSRVRVVADLVNQTSRSINSLTEASFAVNASQQNKEAEIARANQQVAGETGNVHQQVAKKAGESEASLRQALMNIISNNNDTISAIAAKAV